MQHANEVKAFIEHHYRHFNSAALIDAARRLPRSCIDGGGSMFLTLAGAMSTAELGLSLAEMIRAGKVHAICCTGANLEEDVYNLVAHDHYVRVPELPRADAARRAGAARAPPQPRDRHLHPRGGGDPPHRGRDPRRVDARRRAPASASSRTSSSTAILRSGRLDAAPPDRPRRLLARRRLRADLPIFVPGWEDSTSGNIFTSHCLEGHDRQRPHRAHRRSST